MENPVELISKITKFIYIKQLLFSKIKFSVINTVQMFLKRFLDQNNKFNIRTKF